MSSFSSSSSSSFASFFFVFSLPFDWLTSLFQKPLHSFQKQVGLFYFTSKRVARGVRYGPRPRNTADLYVPPGCGFSAAELAEVATAAVARAAALLEAEEAEAASKDKRKKKNSNPSPEIPALFASSPSSPPRPVVVYVTGGAWLIGHRAWGSLLAARLSAASGAVVLCLDYRNFPQAGAGVAAEDVGAGIGWAVAAFDVLSGAKREQNGGEKKRGKEKTQRSGAGVVVVGQSAGAHLSALAILARCAAAEGVALPCVSSNEAAVARMMSAAAAAGGSPKASPSPGTGGSGSSSSSSSASSRSASVDVEVDATENSVVILSAPPHSRPGSSSLASPREPAKPSAPSAAPSPPPLQRHNSLLGPLGLPSLADAAATLGACGPPSFGFGGGGGRFSFPAPPLDPPEWVVSSRAGAGDVAAFVGVSGVYDVASLAPHLARRGLRPRLLERIMSLPVGVSSSATCPSPVSTSTATANGGGGEKAAATRSTASWRPALAELSPTVLLLDCLRKQREDEDASAYLSASPFTPLTYWPSRLPPTALLHGTADACAPASDAARFVEAARAAGAQEVSLRLYDGETHTSPLIENPMRGRGRDALGADLAELVVVAAAAAAAARTTKREGNGGGDGNGDENKRRRNAAPSSGAAPSAHATSATLLRTSSSAAGIPAPKAMHKKERLGAVDGGGALCPAPLIAAAAAVCPF